MTLGVDDPVTVVRGIWTALKNSVAGTNPLVVTTASPTPVVRTISAVPHSVSSGTIVSGCKKLTLVFSSDVAGTLLGQAIPAGLFSLVLDPDSGNVQGAVTFNITAGSFISYETR